MSPLRSGREACIGTANMFYVIETSAIREYRFSKSFFFVCVCQTTSPQKGSFNEIEVISHKVDYISTQHETYWNLVDL